MNKTYTINISGIIFHIDEFAFEKLKGYLNTIRSYFKDSESREEIMTDIESRIAEIFSGRINNAKQVILMEDVDHMISIMGNPEVFKNEDGSESDQSYKEPSSSRNYADTGKRKRIFRDGEDKVLGGVCSGVGNYFDIDPIWIRLAFAASFFYFGSGFLFYIILWMVIPEAKTTAEKLEMRGEKVNINNIEKTLKEEMDGIKNRFNQTVGGDVNARKGGVKGFIQSAIDLIAQLLSGFGKVFLKIIGFIFVFVGIIILVALLASIFGNGGFINISNSGVNSIAFHDILIKFFTTSEQIIEAKIAAFLLIGIPILMFIYQGVKILFRINVRNKWLNITSTLLWLVGLGLTIDVLSSMSNEFKQKNIVKEKFVINNPKSNTLYLNVPESYKWGEEEEDDYKDEDVQFVHNRWNIMVNNEKGLDFYMPIIDIQRSKTDSFELVVMKSSKGGNKKEALRRAESISYSYMVNDSNVIFNPKFDVPETEKWRAQRVKIILKVPTGKSVYLHRKIRPLIYDIDNVTNTFDGDMVNHKWTMRAEGLTCEDCGDVNGFKKKKSLKEPAEPEEPDSDF